MEEQLSIVQQLVNIIGLGSGSVVNDIFGCFFFLTVTLICFNLIFLFVQLFFRRG